MSSRRGRRRGFYERGMPGRAEAAEKATDDEAAVILRAVKTRVASIMSGRPEDMRLLLRGMEALVRARVAERRLSANDGRHLADHIQRALDSLGRQLLPADREPGADLQEPR